MRLFPLLVHRLMKAVQVNRNPFFLKNFNRQVNRETIRVIKLKRIRTGKRLLSLVRKRALHIGKDIQALINRLAELLLLLQKHLENKVLLLLKLRIAVLRAVNNHLCDFRRKLALDAKQSAMTRHTSD